MPIKTALPLLFLLVTTATASAPQSALAAALADARTLPPHAVVYARYLDLSDLPEKDRSTWRRVLAGHLASLSSNPEIVGHEQLGPFVNQVDGGKVVAVPCPTLLRVLLGDYARDNKDLARLVGVWEKLKDVEPYFHVKIEKVTESEEVEETRHWKAGQKDIDGKEWPAGTPYKVKVKKPKARKQVAAAAPWLDPGMVKELVELTQSQCPIARGEWFFQQTAVSVDRDPSYYSFLGIANQKDFERLVGFEEKSSRQFADIWREAVARSGVVTGRRPRRIERLRALGGGLWRSLDNIQTRDKSNPLRVLDDQLEFSASEQFAPGPTGMMIWGLFTNKGDKIDTAPDGIASDQEGVANDSRVHVNLSCIRCHENGGVKDFRPWARALFKFPRSLESPDYDSFLSLRRQYLRPMEEGIEDDRRTYARAIWASTGLTPAQWSKESYRLWTYWADARVDLARAAWSLGTTPECLQAALVHVKKTTGQIDPVAATFMKPEADPIGIETFEELFPILQSYLAGMVPK